MIPNNIDLVYELIDHTDDEVYYPLAIFLSLENAIADIKEGFDEDDYEPPHFSGFDGSEEITLLVKARVIGQYDEGGKEVWKGTFSNDNYDEETDTYQWKLTEEFK